MHLVEKSENDELPLPLQVVFVIKKLLLGAIN